MWRLGPLFLLVGCVDARGDYPGPPELALGFGQAELVPIADGDAVPIAWGPQGGQIVWGAASVRYLDPDKLQLVFSITPPGGTASLRTVRTTLHDADQGFAMTTTVGHLVFLPELDQFRDQPCTWRIEATDRDGRTAVDQKTIIPTWSEP